MSKFSDKEVEDKNLPWWLRLLSPLYEWMEKRRVKKIPLGFDSLGVLMVPAIKGIEKLLNDVIDQYDASLTNEYLDSLPADEQIHHCGTCGGRLDDD